MVQKRVMKLLEMGKLIYIKFVSVCMCVCVYIYVGALVEQEHILKEMDEFLKETLVTEKNCAYDVLVYTAFLHPAVMADIFKCTTRYSRWTLFSFPRSHKYHDQSSACKEPLCFQCQVCLW